MRNALDLHWPMLRRFSADEWPSGTLEQMAAEIILAVSEVRDALPADHTMQPSPLFGAHVRASGNSRHSTKGSMRLSDATDIFMLSWEHALAAWQEAQRHQGIGGIGFYVSKWLGSPNQITPMLHFDSRPERLLWVCRKNPTTGSDQYIYLHSEPALFFKVLGSVLKD